MAQKRKNTENSSMTERGPEGLQSTPSQGTTKRPRKSRSSAAKPGSPKTSAAKHDIASGEAVPGKESIAASPVSTAEPAAGVAPLDVHALKEPSPQGRVTLPEMAAAVRKATEKNALIEKPSSESPAQRAAAANRPSTILSSAVSRREQIALLAYSYWEARGRQGGSAEDDWYRAEREISRRLPS